MTQIAYIFLDVDGVLNSLRSTIGLGGCGRPDKLDRVAMGLLNILCKRLRDADREPLVVVSSTWRKSYPDLRWWRALFGKGGFGSVQFVGITPSLPSGVRGEEVAAWLAEHGQGEFTYVCIDDDSDFLPDQPLVLTTFADGLQIDHISQAFRLLTDAEMPGLPGPRS